ncbi:MAG: AMIN domain-containing protein [Phormidium sp.]
MKYNQGLGGLLFGGTAVLLATQPVWAAPTQVTGVKVQPVGNSVQVILETKEGDRPQIFTVNRQNVFVADITNTQLRLPQGQQFNQQNPAPGIAAVSVTQLAPNSVRLQVTGANAAPTGEVAAKQSDGITFNFNMGGGSAAAPRTPNAVTAPNNPVTAQAPANQTPLVPNPTITYEGGPAPAAGAVQPVSPAPPFLPRAVAPPVGDIAVSEVNSTASAIDLGTAERVPRLLLRDAPVREVLTLLARAANRNVVFLTPQAGAPGQQGQQQQQGAAASLNSTISLDIENEPLQEVFNYVLRITGLQANRSGSTIFVGTSLPEAASNIIVRSLRLNQVPAATAANFLTAQGAETQLPIERVRINTIGEGAAARTVEEREPDIKVLRAQRGVGPLILSGLSVLTNERLNSITLVGDPRKVEIATAFLTQLDARRRQVAINVKIIDINLNNSDFAGSSFSFGVGGAFFTFDNGAAALNFGGVRPPTLTQTQQSQFSPPIIGNNQFFPGGITGELGPFLDAQPNSPFGRSTGFPSSLGNSEFPSGALSRPPFGTNINPLQPGVTNITENGIEIGLPQLFQFPTRLLGFLQAQITSGNGKILTDPTLVIQEGETASVNLGEEVITNIVTEQLNQGGIIIPVQRFEKGNAGLTLQIRVDRIDDNGFVTLFVNPTISAPGERVNLTGGAVITLLIQRKLNSGLLRLRDAQTLIMSGIIQDSDRTTVRKVPVLGDIPIIGALFRSTSRTNARNEVIVMLTPQILDDSGNAPFGYRYRPSPEVQQLLRQRGFTPPNDNPQP